MGWPPDYLLTLLNPITDLWVFSDFPFLMTPPFLSYALGSSFGWFGITGQVQQISIEEFPSLV